MNKTIDALNVQKGAQWYRRGRWQPKKKKKKNDDRKNYSGVKGEHGESDAAWSLDKLRRSLIDFVELWEVLKEDESGSLKATVEEILFQSKRKRVLESHGQVRLGMMRHLYVVIDCSRTMEDMDLKPSRLKATLKLMEAFVDEYFDQNPISQVGLITTKNKRAEKLTDLAGNPKKHITALQKARDTACAGEPSLHMPGHTSREIVIIFSSLTTCDPSNIYELIKSLKALKIRVSVIGLSAEVHVCTVLTRETEGTYHVCLDESHFKELLMFHVKPPPANAQSECSLIRMGFPQHTIASVCDQDSRPSFSMSGSSEAGLSLGGYFCPQCHAKHTELPVECKICGTCCHACQGKLKDKVVFMCLSCRAVFCIDCDLFIHESLHCCPSCINTQLSS
ncbi:hypothetical protein CRUP_020285 [Coryphaenoides rupestris]|nr:hypothetical protein CRUP_020285 [Coryphaenoides rupestris]